MADEKKNSDDFWDISRLVPKNKRVATQFATSVKVSDFYIGGSEASEPANSKIDFSAQDPDAIKVESRSYTPDNSLILKKVTVTPSKDRFDFYDTFRKAALVYFDYKCEKAPFVRFHSYKPQYSQMSVAQKKYYFYWRHEARRGNYIETDYSYIYLYAYEILNLPDKIGKEEGLSLLCDLYCAYHKTFSKLAVNFSVWIQDYCLLYELPVPYEKLSDCLFEIIAATDLKEFYLSGSIASENGAGALLAYLSDYDWRKGRYAEVGTSDIYKTHILGAMRRVFYKLFNESYFNASKTATLRRQAFTGSLCTHSVKCFIEVEYLEFCTSPELRDVVTESLKYVENNLRKLASIKSRLAVRNCPDEIKRIIDRYFEAEFERIKKIRERERAPEYEKLYEAADSGELSMEDALRIERESWLNTARLLEGIEDLSQPDPTPAIGVGVKAPAVAPESVTDASDSITDAPGGGIDSDGSGADTYGLSALEISFIKALLEGNGELAISICVDGSVIPDSITEHINEAFFDKFGDVIIEFDGTSYAVIDDYKEEVSQWISLVMK